MANRICPKCGVQYDSNERFCFRDGSPLGELEPPSQNPIPIRPGVLGAGTLIGGRYQLLSLLGEGAMGMVYLAKQVTLDREVAVKVLHPDIGRNMAAVRRFLVEARAASRVDHPNLVPVFDFGRETSGELYLVMSYVEGRSLDVVIAKEAPLDQLRVVHICQQLLAAMAVAHDKNIIHRDLKPANVIATSYRGDHDFVRILDFGVAKILGEEFGSGPITALGHVMGTPEYMAPEQAKGEVVDFRADLYSVGIIAYEMLTGRVPFDGTLATILTAQIHTPPVPPSRARPDRAVHPDLELVIMTLLAKKPTERFDTADAAAKVLEGIHRTLTAEPRRRDDSEGVASSTPARAETSSGDTGRLTKPTAFKAEPSNARHRIDEILAEIGRLAHLWERKVTEVANLLWGAGRRPEPIAQVLEEIRAGEAQIAESETRIALRRAEGEGSELQARQAQEGLRTHRLDLVARLASMRAALSTVMEHDDEDPTLVGEDPSGLMEDIDEDPTLVREPAGIEKMQRSCETLDEEIAALDLQLSSLTSAHQARIESNDENIRRELIFVSSTRQKLSPRYEDLARQVTELAQQRPELLAHLAALEEVSSAIQLLQAMLEVSK